jgi:hypothetical protein
MNENSEKKDPKSITCDPWLIIIIIITMSQELYALFCIGNPLLDIQVRNGEELLKKYNLNADDAILADEKHHPMLDFLSPNFYNFLMLIPPFRL